MKTKIGHMACPDCGKPVTVRMSDTETMSYRCDECDGNGYCKKGEGRYPTWQKNITPEQSGAAPPEKNKPAAPAKKVSGGSTII